MWCSSEMCGLSQGNYLYIFPHLPTNGSTNKRVNMDIKFYIKPHIQQVRQARANICSQTHMAHLHLSLYLLGQSYTHMRTLT